MWSRVSAFDVQYPVSDPVFTTQTYSSSEAIPHDKMKFVKTGCSSMDFELEPTGWRVPTHTELEALFGGNNSPSLVEVNGQKGCCFNGTSSASSGVFLPAAGRREYYHGNACYRGDYGAFRAEDKFQKCKSPLLALPVS